METKNNEIIYIININGEAFPITDDLSCNENEEFFKCPSHIKMGIITETRTYGNELLSSNKNHKKHI